MGWFSASTSMKAVILLAFVVLIINCVQAATCDELNCGFQEGGVKHRKLGGTRVEAETGATLLLFAGGGSLLMCVYLCPCCYPKSKNVKSKEQIVRRSEISPQSTSATLSPRFDSGSRIRSDPVESLNSGFAALTFTKAELVRITGNFSPSHKIGDGSSGTIYKGKLRDGTLVAVKRAKKDSFETRHTIEFQNEVNMLSNVEHLNLVRLLGYLEDERERILVVEYVPNGTLREHLDGKARSLLDFATRLDIAIDVAHALTYLHLYAEQPIIHRDVKSSNILLTDTYRAKVADFGFSRIGPADVGATHVSTQVKGTAGYLDPEYLQTYQLTTKSDVYSFGILLIEIFSSRRPIELTRPSDERITIRWAFNKYDEGRIQDVLDPVLPKSPILTSTLERIAEVAFKCAAPSKKDRPTMKEAAEILWNIRKDFQASCSQSATPRVGTFSPLQSPFHRLQSPLQSPLHRSMDRSPLRSPLYKHQIS